MNRFLLPFLCILLLLIVSVSIPIEDSTASPATSHHYYHQIVNLEDGLQFATGKDVIIAIIDTGIDLNHPALVNHIWTNPNEIAGNSIDDDGNGYIDDLNGWNFKDNTNIVDLGTDSSHGTRVAGVIRQFAPDATIMPIVFYVSTFSAVDTVSKLPEAVNYAVDNGAKVIVMPFGINAQLHENTYQVFEYAIDQNVTLVSATGNSNQESIFYPAAYDTVIAVGAVDQSLNRAVWSQSSGSNYGLGIDIVAGGTAISTTNYGGGSVTDDGTSYASPTIAALAALLYELRPSISASEVRGILQNTAQDLGLLGYDDQFGHGLVDFGLAVRIVSDVSPPSLVSTQFSIHPVNSTHGYLYYQVDVIDESGITACEFSFRLTHEDSYSTLSSCSGIPSLSLPDEESLIVSLNTSISGSLVRFYFKVFDWTDKALSIGNASHPITISTGLQDIAINPDDQSTTTPDDPDNPSLTNPFSSTTTTDRSSTGEWETVTGNHSLSVAPLFIVFFGLLVVFLNRRYKH